MNLLVDTSVWSLALRRDPPSNEPAVHFLSQAIEDGESIFTTGLILQELLQGFAGPKARDLIVEKFAALPLLTPDRTDHIEAAALRNACRRNGVQAGTVDCLLAQLAIRHGLTMVTTDRDFEHIARVQHFEVWRP
ncbi:MAG: PIN domain-containing protein [Acidobacteria bacterium]|nr:PIN domain-containing protein [Acidobacteriota bacterium]